MGQVKALAVGSVKPVPGSTKSQTALGASPFPEVQVGEGPVHIEKMFIKKILLILYQKDFFCGNQASSIV